MNVLCVGVDHRTTPLAVRERLAFSVHEAGGLLAGFAAGRLDNALAVDELAILSTCNRVELYAALPDGSNRTDESIAALTRLLSRAGDDRHDDLAPARYAFSGQDAERHLCRVAGGLESMVLGEAEILGQIADAFALAGRVGATGPVLEALSDTALKVGRRARAETAIGRNPASVSSVAAELAAALAPELRERRALLIGAGKMARIAADLLVAQGGWSLRVASRTLDSAQLLAERVGGEAIASEGLREAVTDADLVIASSASPIPVLGADFVRVVMQERRDRPLAILDIAVPRDVDPAVRTIPGVRLFDVDELRPRIEESLAMRRQEIPGVEAIVEHELRRLAARRHGAALLRIVDEWRYAAEETRRSEVERALGANPPGDETLRDQLERLSVSLVKRLLDEPSRRLRTEAANGHADQYATFAQRLFGIEDVS